MPLYPIKIDLRSHGNSASICGWGSVKEDDVDDVGDASFSDNLNCLNIQLANRLTCFSAIRFGDYSKVLICGRAKYPDQKTTLVITLKIMLLYIFVKTNSSS